MSLNDKHTGLEYGEALPIFITNEIKIATFIFFTIVWFALWAYIGYTITSKSRSMETYRIRERLESYKSSLNLSQEEVRECQRKIAHYKGYCGF